MVTRDILKSGVNLPVVGPISFAGIIIIGGLVLLYLKSRKGRKTVIIS